METPLSVEDQESVERWLAVQDRHAQLLDGKLVIQAMPFVEHGSAQGNVFGQLLRAQRPGPGNPGWWLATEADLLLGKQGVRPDLTGWRRDEHPRPPQPVVVGRQKVITATPNWVCEVLSTSTASVDLGRKRDIYHQAGVAHYWIIDTFNKTLVVYRRTADGYLLVLSAGDNEIVHAEPFAFLEVDTSYLFLASADPSEGTP